MKEISYSKVKELELEMLKFVDGICRSNNLRYFLVGGTLIGAVRHKGFIPWDDDIDISMPRGDYEKLLTILKNKSEYKVMTPETPGYYYNFSKLVDKNTYLIEKNRIRHIPDMGVYIDIFPFDGLPLNSSECKKTFRTLKQLDDIVVGYWHPMPILRKRINVFFRNIPYWLKYGWRGLEYTKKIILEIVNEYDFDKSEYVCTVGGAYGEKEIYPRRFFDGIVFVEFEGHEFFAPAGYDEFLTQMYGDYMELPPVDKRVSNHDFVAYWKEDNT